MDILININEIKNANGCIIPTVLETPSIPYKEIIEKNKTEYVKNAGIIETIISKPEYRKIILYNPKIKKTGKAIKTDISAVQRTSSLITKNLSNRR